MTPASAKSKLIKGATGDWEVVIGMEVHAQVTAQAKLFSGAATAFGGAPNAVEAPENNFALEVTWAWTSMPMTTSQSPVAPLISLDFRTGASIAQSRLGLRSGYALPQRAARAAPAQERAKIRSARLRET